MVDDLLKALSYSNSTEILHYLNGGKKRFVDIENDLSLNPNIVNMRLKDLRSVDLVDKVKRGTYRLTDKGERAAQILERYHEDGDLGDLKEEL